MDDPQHTHTTVLHSGADYLDGIVADMENQAREMDAKAKHTSIAQVRDGYERFAEVLRHCVETLREKSRELRGL
jgi:hypothetical protein